MGALDDHLLTPKSGVDCLRHEQGWTLTSITERGGSAAMIRHRLLASKLNPPQASPFELARSDVGERIFDAGAARLVLLRAPAGFGKTTVMLQARQRFEQSGIATSWLTLDAADNDEDRFFTVLAAALDTVVPNLAPKNHYDASALTLELLDRVSAHPAPFVLFLDDFEAVQTPGVIGFVGQLIEQLPSGGQLIIGSRGVPGLELGRLRAQGHLLEIVPSELRFSIGETTAYLREHRNVELSEDDVLRLHRSTEGWPAALWLASISLQERDDPGRFISGFSGSNAAVAEYLLEDVLAKLPEGLREFLLQTSILNPLCASLCDHVCGANGSEDTLVQLERSNQFLIPLEGKEGWFRYHSLFGEFLRSQLVRQNPEEALRLHRAASDWFLAQGRFIPAIEHALSSGEKSHAIELLASHAETLLVQGRVRLLNRWLEPLATSGALADQPLLQLIHIWAVLFTRGAREAATLLEGFHPETTPDAGVEAHRLAMHPTVLALMDHVEEAFPLAVDNFDRLADGSEFPRAFLAVSLANTAICVGDFSTARNVLDAERRISGGAFNTILWEATEAAIDLGHGRLRQAIARLRIATRLTQGESSRPTNGNAMAGILLAEALYEADICESAEHLLSVYLPLIGNAVVPDSFILGHIIHARIVASKGDFDRAFQLLAELEYLGNRAGLSRSVACARLERARLMLWHGHGSAAREELERAGTDEMWESVSRLSLRANEVETRAVGLARWAIRTGTPDRVIGSLTDELTRAERANRLRRALTLRILLAEALWRGDKCNRALRVLGDAVEFAVREGYVRAFTDEGGTVAQMVAALRELPPATDTDLRTAAAVTLFEQLNRSQAGRKVAVTVPPDAVTDSPMVSYESLTRREMQVLQLLARGLSNTGIGERLFIAETTVRTHLRNITVKLGAHNRTEIISIARQRRLID